jgi:LysM repeat protein
VPSRDHRCAAFSPAAPLAPEKQSRLCLTPAHTTCATFIASMAAREERLGAPPTERATRWGLARTTTVIEDPGGVRARVVGVLVDRRRWPAIPAILLVTTLFALALSGFRPGLPSAVVTTPTPAPPTAAPTAISTPPASTPSPSPAPSEPATGPTPSAAATPTAVPTSTPTATTGPSPTFQTYRVRPGDTLSAIAAKYHTTVQAIVALNHLPNANQLSVGQILLIP